MQLGKFRLATGEVRAGILDGEQVHLLTIDSLTEVLHAPAPTVAAGSRLLGRSLPLDQLTPLAPVDRQEIWAAGVTYKRSREARERESVGAAHFYDLVYTAERPELFLKATPERVVGPGEVVHIRRDSRWSVPEPELALVISPELRIVGYTIGNDMSARDIEGENPLYLPQAKVYDRSCAVGPVVTLAADMPPREQVEIRLTIERQGKPAFEGKTSLGSMARPLEELVSWLGRETSFPHGAVLLTGTGIVPPDDFTLAAGDIVTIAVTGIGRLINAVGLNQGHH
jgi:2-dehydro-3-deoxy-D-arabinonate dehydratase